MWLINAMITFCSLFFNIQFPFDTVGQVAALLIWKYLQNRYSQQSLQIDLASNEGTTKLVNVGITPPYPWTASRLLSLAVSSATPCMPQPYLGLFRTLGFKSKQKSVLMTEINCGHL